MVYWMHHKEINNFAKLFLLKMEYSMAALTSKKIYLCLAVVIIGCTFVSSVSATAQWAATIYDNFDSGTAGQVPTNWTEVSPGYFDLTASQAFSGTLSLEQKTSDAGNAYIIYRSDSAGLTDVQVKAFAFQYDFVGGWFIWQAGPEHQLWLYGVC